jgi:hypothetical protein
MRPLKTVIAALDWLHGNSSESLLVVSCRRRPNYPSTVSARARYHSNKLLARRTQKNSTTSSEKHTQKLMQSNLCRSEDTASTKPSLKCGGRRTRMCISCPPVCRLRRVAAAKKSCLDAQHDGVGVLCTRENRRGLFGSLNW